MSGGLAVRADIYEYAEYNDALRRAHMSLKVWRL